MSPREELAPLGIIHDPGAAVTEPSDLKTERRRTRYVKHLPDNLEPDIEYLIWDFPPMVTTW